MDPLACARVGHLDDRRLPECRAVPLVDGGALAVRLRGHRARAAVQHGARLPVPQGGSSRLRWQPRAPHPAHHLHGSGPRAAGSGHRIPGHLAARRCPRERGADRRPVRPRLVDRHPDRWIHVRLRIPRARHRAHRRGLRRLPDLDAQHRDDDGGRWHADAHLRQLGLPRNAGAHRRLPRSDRGHRHDADSHLLRAPVRGGNGRRQDRRDGQQHALRAHRGRPWSRSARSRRRPRPPTRRGARAVAGGGAGAAGHRHQVVQQATAGRSGTVRAAGRNDVQRRLRNGAPRCRCGDRPHGALTIRHRAGAGIRARFPRQGGPLAQRPDQPSHAILMVRRTDRRRRRLHGSHARARLARRPVLRLGPGSGQPQHPHRQAAPRRVDEAVLSGGR